MKKQLAVLAFVSLTLAVMSVAPMQQVEAKGVLKVKAIFSSKLTELSGMALLESNEEKYLYSVGDNRSLLHIQSIQGEDITDEKMIDFSHIINNEFPLCKSQNSIVCKEKIKSRNSQWEGLAIDGEKNLFLLREYPSAVFVLNFLADKVLSIIKLDYSYSKWKKSKSSNSLGEGIVLLKNGHLLVAKEDDPPALIEFGLKGDKALGYSTKTVLGKNDEFLVSDRRLNYSVLNIWKLPKKYECDISELAIGTKKELYILSQTCGKIFVTKHLKLGQKTIDVKKSYLLPSVVQKPEALVVLKKGKIIVGSDSKKSKRVIFTFDLPNTQEGMNFK